MFFIVSYNPTCRDCCKTHGVSHLLTVNSDSKDSFLRYKKMTEYEFSVILEDWLKDSAQCIFCGSQNIFGENIEIDHYKLYDFDRLVDDLKNETNVTNLLIIQIQKKIGETELKTAGKQKNESDFILECMVKVIPLLNELPNNNFVKNKTDGYFQIVISGINYNGNHTLTIQRLINYGFDRTEITNRVGNYFFKYPLL